MIDYGKNGEEFTRNWIRISRSTNSVFCLPCCVFGTEIESPWGRYGNGQKGFQQFHRSKRSIRIHEESSNHLQSMANWQFYLRNQNCVASALQKKSEEDLNQLRLVLHAVLDAILYLASNNLALRGDSNQILASNCGNFLGLIKLLGKYYAPLATHIEKMKPHKTAYLSSTSQNEFIYLIANELRSSIIRNIRERKYYSILFDGTPDVSKQDQLSEVIRSVECSNAGCVLHENFIDFIPTTTKTGELLSGVILKKLETDGLDIQNCRGQGYDNGANMAGSYKGVQARIQEINPRAKFIPCAAHSLNLVGTNAAEKIKPAKMLLGDVQNLYVFFAGSTSRWKILKNNCGISLKCISATRWSSRANAVEALWNQFEKVVDALEEITENNEFSSDVTSMAEGRLRSLLSFKFILGLCIWKRILVQVDKCNEYLQTKSLNLSPAAKRLDALCEWLIEFKETAFDSCVNEAKELAETVEVSMSSGFEDIRRGRGVNKKYMDRDAIVQNASLNAMDRFRLDFFSALCSQLIVEMKNRFEQIKSASITFGFLWGKDLVKSKPSPNYQALHELCEAYPDDLEYSSFAAELASLPSVVKKFAANDVIPEDLGPLEILSLLYTNYLNDTYKNCSIALRIFLSLPVSVASNERSFSKLRRIKDYTRSTMGQERLSGLALISIEKEAAAGLDRDKLVDEFAKKCVRRKNLLKKNSQ